MNVNNFDQASNGLNLELTFERDEDLARMDFEDNFVRLDSGEFVFTQYGNFDQSYFDLTDFENYNFKKATKKQISDLLLTIENRDYLNTLNDNYKSFSRLSKDELIELLEYILEENHCKGDRIDFLQENFEPLYGITEIRGYSQGDYDEIVIPENILQSLNIKPEDADQVFSEEFANLFYDQPLYALLTIGSDEEMYLPCNGLYEYNKETTIKETLKELGSMKQFTSGVISQIDEFLNNNLPEFI